MTKLNRLVILVFQDAKSYPYTDIDDLYDSLKINIPEKMYVSYRDLWLIHELNKDFFNFSPQDFPEILVTFASLAEYFVAKEAMDNLANYYDNKLPVSLHNPFSKMFE